MSTEFRNRQTLEAALKARNVPHVEELVSAARWAAYLHAMSPSNKRKKSGLSKIGGLPDLPANVDWPVRNAYKLRNKGAPALLAKDDLSGHLAAYFASPQPLSFLAQIDLAEIAAVLPAEPGLPTFGMLYFFYDVVYNAWGFDPHDAPAFAVIYSEAASGLAPRNPPDIGEKPEAFPVRRLKPHRTLTAVPDLPYYRELLGMSPEAWEEYATLIFDLGIEADIRARHPGVRPAPDHRLVGWPDIIQNEMEPECALVTGGIYCGDGRGYASEEGRRILAEPNDWRLLLQIDSDEDHGKLWGDAGKLYFWIREQDLAARDFKRCWLIQQCG